MSERLDGLLEKFAHHKGADLYLTVGCVPLMRGDDAQMLRLDEGILEEEDIQAMILELLTEDAVDEFASTLEYNTAVYWKQKIRLRVNVFRQRQSSGVVLRRISSDIPTITELKLPKAYENLALEKRGLVLVAGPTGSGKSTSMAAMVNHRNENVHGHIVTVEDPVEFVHEHKSCIITQRDVGIDTYSYGIALKNVLRQRPDVIVIGEIRDRDTMEHALKFAETGHLCIATIHAGNTHQALERIVNFFPEDKQKQIWLALSISLRGILCQRLVANIQEMQSLATEIMLNQGLIRDLLHDGRVRDVLSMIEKSRDLGMMSLDQSLLNLVEAGEISTQAALIESDNPSNVKLQLTKHDMDARVSRASFKAPNSF